MRQTYRSKCSTVSNSNPTDLNVEAGAEKLKELGDVVVVPIGGGSSMDCGKSIALLASNPGTVEAMQGSQPTPAAAPVIAVPTTAGNGVQQAAARGEVSHTRKWSRRSAGCTPAMRACFSKIQI